MARTIRKPEDIGRGSDWRTWLVPGFCRTCKCLFNKKMKFYCKKVDGEIVNINEKSECDEWEV